MNWSGRRVVVTGAGGFIGSQLTERLVEEGAAVRALTHYNALGRSGWLDESPVRDHIDVIAGDVCDPDMVASAVEGADTVFHLAALIGIPYSYAAPMSYVRTNVEGTLNVLTAARKNGVRRVVHTSTSEAYGTALYVPIDEKHPLQGQSPYSASKIGADKMAEAFFRSFGVPVVTVRPFNTFGPRQSARAVIPTIIVQALNGQNIRLGNTTPTRDLNYVQNTIDGFVLAAQSDDAIGQTINFGSGEEIAIGDLVQAVSGAMGRSLPIEHEANRVRPSGSEVDRLVADNRLAAQLLGWKPRVTFRDGLRRTIDWFEKNIERYRASAYTV